MVETDILVENGSNGCESQCPSFIDEDYLEKALQNYENDPSIKVLKFTSKPAVAGGNNYVSLMLRSAITYKSNNNEHTKSVIIKTVLTNSESAKMFKELQFYDKELIMYSKVLPKYEKLLNDIGDTDKMYSPAILVDHDNYTLIFEDLTCLDYEVADRKKGVDWEHTHLLVCKIAKYHALSMVLAEQEGDEIFEPFNKGVVQETEGATKYHTLMLQTLAEQVSTWPGYEKYAVKLRKMKSFVVKQGSSLYEAPHKQHMKVLIHGDLWTNNMLFKYGPNRKPTDLLLIDFQIGYYGSPLFDLIYFTCTSVQDEILKERFPEILQLYHKSLCYNLDKLKYKGSKPTLFELNQQYAEKSFFEIIAAALIGPIMLNNQEEGGIEKLIGDNDEANDFRKQLYQTERHQNSMKHLLPIWDKKGILDPLTN